MCMLATCFLLGTIYFIIGSYVASATLGVLVLCTAASDGSIRGWPVPPVSFVLGFCWPLIFVFVGTYIIVRKILT